MTAEITEHGHKASASSPPVATAIATQEICDLLDEAMRMVIWTWSAAAVCIRSIRWGRIA